MTKSTERLILGVAAILIGLLAGWMLRGALTYNRTQESAVTYEDWRVVCPAATNKEIACAMAAAVVDPASKSPIANISITKDDKKAQIISFMLPFDVALEPGVGLQIGKDPVKVYKFRTCNAQGCVVVAAADDKLVSSLASATDVKLLFIGANSADGKPVDPAVSLKGFTTARRAYLSSEAKRNSWFWRLWS